MKSETGFTVTVILIIVGAVTVLGFIGRQINAIVDNTPWYVYIPLGIIASVLFLIAICGGFSSKKVIK
jgi:hypothetical protein